MNCKDLIMAVLVESSVIPENYTGKIILHCGEGSISDVECVEHKRRRTQLLEKKILDIPKITGKIGGK
jgi:hypothetical protein